MPSDPELRRLLDESSAALEITSDPSGADVFARGYTKDEEQFDLLGRTPLTAPCRPVQSSC